MATLLEKAQNMGIQPQNVGTQQPARPSLLQKAQSFKLEPAQSNLPVDPASFTKKIEENAAKARNLVFKDIIGAFTGKEIPEGEKPTSFIGQLAFDAFQSTLGSKGALGFGAEAGRALSSIVPNGGIQQELANYKDTVDARKQLEETKQNFINRARGETNLERKNKFLKQVADIDRELGVMGEEMQRIEDRIPDVKGLAGKALNTVLTAFTGSTGGNLSRNTLMRGLTEIGASTGTLAKVAKVTNLGKNLAIRSVESGLLATGFQVANNAITDRPLSEGIGFAFGIGAALPVGFYGLEKAKQFLVEPTVNYVTKRLPARINNATLKPLEKNFRFGKNPGEAMLNEGIVANSFEDVVSRGEAIRKQVGAEKGRLLDLPTNQEPNLSLKPALSVIDEEIKKVVQRGPEAEPYLKRLIDIRDGMTNEYREVQGKLVQSGQKKIDNLTAKELDTIKMAVGESTTWTGQAFDNDINQLKSRVYNKLDDMIDEAVPGIEKLNQRYADLLSLKSAAQRQVSMQERRNLIGFTQKFRIPIEVAAGILTGRWDIVGSILLAEAGIKAFESVAVQTRVAKFLRSLAPGQRESILQTTPLLKHLYERFTGKEAKASEMPPIGLSIKEVSEEGVTQKAGGIKQGIESATEFIESQKIESPGLKLLKKNELPLLGDSKETITVYKSGDSRSLEPGDFLTRDKNLFDKNEPVQVLKIPKNQLRIADPGVTELGLPTKNDLIFDNRNKISDVSEKIKISGTGQKPKKVGTGEFGDIYKGITGQDAVDFLLRKKGGEVQSAIKHPKIGNIDIVYGKSGKRGYGLAHIQEKHPEVIEKLVEIIPQSVVVQEFPDRSVVLYNKKLKSIISLTWGDQPKKWLITSYEELP